MGAKIHSLLRDLPPRPRKTEDLEAAGIREDRPPPVHKAMEPPQLPDQLLPRPDMEVVGVGELHLRPDLLKIIRGQAPLDRRRGPHIHENRRLDHAVHRLHMGGLCSPLLRYDLIPQALLLSSFAKRGRVSLPRPERPSPLIRVFLYP